MFSPFPSLIVKNHIHTVITNILTTAGLNDFNFTFHRNHSLNVQCGSFPGLWECLVILSLDAGQQQGITAPSQPSNHEES